MPCKNTIKQYVEGGYYHIYNRGVNKDIIFKDQQDYSVFLRFLKEYLLPPNHHDLEILRKIAPRRIPINCFVDIDLLAYCLMPNHFHLFVKQKTSEGLKTFMKALATNYVIYFNRKYDRIGPLFQGIYKAVLIQNESYLLHMTRYIHTNPVELFARDGPLQDYLYSSYSIYLGKKKYEWVKPDEILSMFSKGTKRYDLYRKFIEDDITSDQSSKILTDLKLEEN